MRELIRTKTKVLVSYLSNQKLLRANIPLPRPYNCKNYNLEICSQNAVLHFRKCRCSQEYKVIVCPLTQCFVLGNKPLSWKNIIVFGPWQIPNLNLNIHGETLYSITSEYKLTGVLKNRVNNELKWTGSRIALVMNFSLSLRRSADAEASNLIIHKWPSQFC